MLIRYAWILIILIGVVFLFAGRDNVGFVFGCGFFVAAFIYYAASKRELTITMKPKFLAVLHSKIVLAGLVMLAMGLLVFSAEWWLNEKAMAVPLLLDCAFFMMILGLFLTLVGFGIVLKRSITQIRSK